MHGIVKNKGRFYPKKNSNWNSWIELVFDKVYIELVFDKVYKGSIDVMKGIFTVVIFYYIKAIVAQGRNNFIKNNVLHVL